jgi:hypothetical protein
MTARWSTAIPPAPGTSSAPAIGLRCAGLTEKMRALGSDGGEFAAQLLTLAAAEPVGLAPAQRLAHRFQLPKSSLHSMQNGRPFGITIEVQPG